jgi:hypothetical protein
MGKIGERIVTGNEEEDVGSYWINVSRQEDAGN